MIIQVILVMLVMLLTACASGGEPASTARTNPIDLTSGDPVRGEELYNATINRQPSCASCHSLDRSTVVGPSLMGFGEVAGARVEGENAHQYAYHSIVEPGAYLVEGYENIMPATYTNTFTEQEIADLVAFILSQ